MAADIDPDSLCAFTFDPRDSADVDIDLRDYASECQRHNGELCETEPSPWWATDDLTEAHIRERIWGAR